MSSVTLHAGLEPFPGYRLIQLRGQGGYAEVWDAETPQGTKAALKFLSGIDSRSAPREIRAIQALRQLYHPNLVEIYQVWCYQSYIVISMELAEGSLQDLLEAYQIEFGTPIVPEHVCLLMAQAAKALDFLNKRQHHIDGQIVAIQHCDVKPSNMLLFGETLKMTDFGLSSLTSAQLQYHRRAGTLDFAAPEVFQGRLSDNTDQYALAVSYCQLRSGQMPFPDTPKSFDPDYVRPEPELSMLAPKEREIIARALASAPPDRWPSCTELIEQLAQAIT